MVAQFGRACGALVGVSLLAMSTGCGTDSGGTPTVVVGAGSDMRDEVLAQIYAGAVRSAGVDVDVKTDLGGLNDVLQRLDAGDVTLVPDVTGDLLAVFDSNSRVTEAEDVFTDLNRSLPEGLSVGDYALAEDRTTVAVSTSGEYAAVDSLSDFAPYCAGDAGPLAIGVVTGAASPEQTDVAEILDTGYGCTAGEFVNYADSQTALDALNSGEVGALAVRTASFGPLSTDSRTLEDDRAVFTAQNVVPLLREGAVDDAAFAALSVVAGELTTADLAEMIDEVRGGADSGDVAVSWLGEHNL